MSSLTRTLRHSGAVDGIKINDDLRPLGLELPGKTQREKRTIHVFVQDAQTSVGKTKTCVMMKVSLFLMLSCCPSLEAVNFLKKEVSLREKGSETIKRKKQLATSCSGEPGTKEKPRQKRSSAQLWPLQISQMFQESNVSQNECQGPAVT